MVRGIGQPHLLLPTQEAGELDIASLRSLKDLATL